MMLMNIDPWPLTTATQWNGAGNPWTLRTAGYYEPAFEPLAPLSPDPPRVHADPSRDVLTLLRREAEGEGFDVCAPASIEEARRLAVEWTPK